LPAKTRHTGCNESARNLLLGPIAYGVRDGLWWVWITGVIVPVVGLAMALPLHYMGHFNYDWVSHLGPIYVGTIIYVVGAVVALLGLSQAAPGAARASDRRLERRRLA
jgi:uncharacterized membrane protein